MQPQFIQRRQDPLLILFQGRLRTRHGQQGREQPDGFREQFISALTHPPQPVGHAPGQMPIAFPGRPAVHGLLEQGHPGFVPQAVSQKQRRIRTHRNHDGTDELGGIVQGGEIRRPNPEMYLERGIRSFQCDVVTGHVERVEPVDAYLKWPVPQFTQRGGKRTIPGKVGQGCRLQVLFH